jgi:hypothetical protein
MHRCGHPSRSGDELAKAFVVDTNKAQQLSDRLRSAGTSIEGFGPAPPPIGPLGSGALQQAWSEVERGFATAKQNRACLRREGPGRAAHRVRPGTMIETTEDESDADGKVPVIKQAGTWKVCFSSGLGETPDPTDTTDTTDSSGETASSSCLADQQTALEVDDRYVSAATYSVPDAQLCVYGTSVSPPVAEDFADDYFFFDHSNSDGHGDHGVRRQLLGHRRRGVVMSARERTVRWESRSSSTSTRRSRSARS